MGAKIEWVFQRTPNRVTALDDLDLSIQDDPPKDRAYRPEDGRTITGGYRMNAREFRRWRRLLDRLDRTTRRRARRARKGTNERP